MFLFFFCCFGITAKEFWIPKNECDKWMNLVRPKWWWWWWWHNQKQLGKKMMTKFPFANIYVCFVPFVFVVKIDLRQVHGTKQTLTITQEFQESTEFYHSKLSSPKIVTNHQAHHLRNVRFFFFTFIHLFYHYYIFSSIFQLSFRNNWI